MNLASMLSVLSNLCIFDGLEKLCTHEKRKNSW